MSDEFPVEGQPALGFTGRFEPIVGFIRRHFHRGRGGRAKLAITTTLLSRVVTASVNLLVLPMTVRYLGNEGYGLMTTITSVVGWLQFTNLGIGLGLQNALTEETAKGNARAQKELVSTAFLSLTLIGIVLGVVGLVTFPHINWPAVFRPTTDRFVAEIPWTVLIVFLGFVSTIILSFLSPIYAARQELHLGSILALTSSLSSLVGTVVAVHFRWGLLGITICTIGVIAVIQWAFAFWTLYGRGISDLRPAVAAITRTAARRIYTNGISFLALQIFSIAFFQIDAFLIARFLTVDQVTPYTVAQKVFLQASGLFSVVTASLWSAYGNAKAHGDYQWIQRTHRKMVTTFTLLFGGVSIAMVLFGHRLLSLWVGANAAPGTILIGGVALLFCFRDWTALHATLLNGLDVIRPQVWNLGLTAALTLAFDLLLVRRFGPVGLAIGGSLAFALAGAWYLPLLTRRTLRHGR